MGYKTTIDMYTTVSIRIPLGERVMDSPAHIPLRDVFQFASRSESG